MSGPCACIRNSASVAASASLLLPAPFCARPARPPRGLLRRGFGRSLLGHCPGSFAGGCPPPTPTATPPLLVPTPTRGGRILSCVPKTSLGNHKPESRPSFPVPRKRCSVLRVALSWARRSSGWARTAYPRGSGRSGLFGSLRSEENSAAGGELELHGPTTACLDGHTAVRLGDQAVQVAER